MHFISDVNWNSIHSHHSCINIHQLDFIVDIVKLKKNDVLETFNLWFSSWCKYKNGNNIKMLICTCFWNVFSIQIEQYFCYTNNHVLKDIKSMFCMKMMKKKIMKSYFCNIDIKVIILVVAPGGKWHIRAPGVVVLYIWDGDRQTTPGEEGVLSQRERTCVCRNQKPQQSPN